MIIETFTLVNITNGFRLPRKSKSCYQQHDRRQSRGSSPGHMISHQHQDDTLYWNTGILGHFQLTSSQLSFFFSWSLTFYSHSTLFHNPPFLLPSILQHGSCYQSLILSGFMIQQAVIECLYSLFHTHISLPPHTQTQNDIKCSWCVCAHHFSYHEYFREILPELL